MKMKRTIISILAAALCAGLLTGCGAGASDAISVVSREDGSGTRGAFTQLFGVEQKKADGSRADLTTTAAEITNSTAVMLTTVAGNPAAIGYVSMGSLDDSVRALEIDGEAASADNIRNGAYKIARPFNIAALEGISAQAQDFIGYILSDEGQQIITDNGYISLGGSGDYKSGGASGKITVAGSSSVSPVMEKLAEAYMAVNPDVTIELQTSDSTTGMTSAAQGLCDIGMASRELKDSETGAGLTATVIAMDGIAVIVNTENSLKSLTSGQVRSIFTGETSAWSEIR